MLRSVSCYTEYQWQGLASSTNFSGSTLKECLSAIHTDIIASWNFNDPDKVNQPCTFSIVASFPHLPNLAARQQRFSGENDEACSIGNA
jgi:hypothetical protein